MNIYRISTYGNAITILTCKSFIASLIFFSHKRLLDMEFLGTQVWIFLSFLILQNYFPKMCISLTTNTAFDGLLEGSAVCSPRRRRNACPPLTQQGHWVTGHSTATPCLCLAPQHERQWPTGSRRKEGPRSVRLGCLHGPGAVRTRQLEIPASATPGYEAPLVLTPDLQVTTRRFGGELRVEMCDWWRQVSKESEKTTGCNRNARSWISKIKWLKFSPAEGLKL